MILSVSGIHFSMTGMLFSGIMALTRLSPSPPLKEERGGVRRPRRIQIQHPSPQPSPRLGGERESKPPPFGNFIKDIIPLFRVSAVGAWGWRFRCCHGRETVA
jgi:hypothetical protein